MKATRKSRHIKAAHQVLISLGLPRAQQNERSALCILALLNLIPGTRASVTNRSRQIR